MTQDYRQEKEESKETMALEVITETENWKEWLGMCTQQENTGRDGRFVLCAAFYCVNR